MSSRSASRACLLAVAVVVALLPAAGAARSQPAEDAGTSPAPRAAKPIKTVNRSYGGKVVQTSREQRLRIRFRGTEGDLVALRSFPNPAPRGCETAVLRQLDSGRKVAQQVSALWRLPKSARYVVTYRQDCYLSVSEGDAGDGSYLAGVRLSEVVTHPLVPGGPAVELPVENKVLHVAVLTVADARAVAVAGEWLAGWEGRHTWSSVLVPPSMVKRSGRGDTFNSLPNDEGSPVIVRKGAALTQTAPRIEGGFWELPLHYPPARGFVPSVGDEIWFADPRAGVRASASYVD